MNGALDALWTFPAILGAALAIAWAAESAQFLIAQGMALAILAWLQTAPEFAVEAVIAWEAPTRPNGAALISANLTGSLRLLVGLGWPLVFAAAAFFSRRRRTGPLGCVRLDEKHSVEVLGLLPGILYFVWIWAKGTLTVFDSLPLAFFYLTYLWVLNRMPPEDLESVDEEEWPIRSIHRLRPRLRNAAIALLFVAGGLGIYLAAEPFFHSMLSLAVALGVSQYVFIQWVAPFLSEFPEKVSALYWARKPKGAPMALMNLVSSNINQWTVLAAMIPPVYAVSTRGLHPVVLDAGQRSEILLTLAQSGLGFLFLADLEFWWYEAAGLFALWLVQFLRPDLRPAVTWLYFGWIAAYLGLAAAGRRSVVAFSSFRRLWTNL